MTPTNGLYESSVWDGDYLIIRGDSGYFYGYFHSIQNNYTEFALEAWSVKNRIEYPSVDEKRYGGFLETISLRVPEEFFE